MSAPSDRGWHTTTLLQGGGNQQAHVDTPADHGPDPGQGQGNDKRRRRGRGVDNGNGMWWLNKCDGNVIVVFGGLRYMYKHNNLPAATVLIASSLPLL